MTGIEWLEKIERLEQELAELKKERITDDKKKPARVVREKEGGAYWSVGDCGLVACLSEDEDYGDNWRYKTRNYFNSEVEAQDYLDYLNTRCALMDLADELNADNPLDWSDYDQEKWFIAYHHENATIFNSWCTVDQKPHIYCTNPNFKYIAIERIGKEWLVKYLTYSE